MMAVESKVRWFNSTMAGAPIMNGTAGSLIGILDACLLSGFGTATPDGDKITVASGVATVEFSGGNGFKELSVVEISGATPAALNSEWRVASASANSFTFDCPGIPDGIATGPVSVKLSAPGGWSKVFTDTNKAVYRSLSPGASGAFYRIDDTFDRYAKIRGYESMTGVDAGANPFPTLAQLSGEGALLPRSSAADSTPRDWWVIADDRTVYFCSAISVGTYSDFFETFVFGDYEWLSGAGPSSLVMGSKGGVLTYPSHFGLAPYSPNNVWVPRGVDLTYGPRNIWFMLKTNAFGDGARGAYPQPANNGLVLDYPVFLNEGANNSPILGHMPGLYNPLHGCGPLAGQILDNLGGDGLTGVVFGGDSPWAKGFILIDIVGPWR